MQASCNTNDLEAVFYLAESSEGILRPLEGLNDTVLSLIISQCIIGDVKQSQMS